MSNSMHAADRPFLRAPSAPAPSGALLCAVLAAAFAYFMARYLYTIAHLEKPYPFGDFFALWSYPKIAAQSSVAALYDVARLHDAQVAMGMAPEDSNPFPYPPTVMLFLAPLRGLAYGPALILWLSATFLLYAAAVLGGRRLHPLAAAATLLAPTTTISFVSGQSGLLAAALLVGGMRLSGRRPVLAGILLALLTYKPQLGILVPVALLAAGNWRCLAATIASVIILVGLTSALMGWDVWWAWAECLPAYQRMFADSTTNNPQLETVLADAIWLGASPQMAHLLQGLASAVSVVLVWKCFRSGPRDLAIIVLLAATCLATPHAFVYDLPMLSAGAILFLAACLRAQSEIEPLEKIVLLLVLVFPVAMTSAGTHLPLAAPSQALFLAALMHRRSLALAGWKTGAKFAIA